MAQYLDQPRAMDGDGNLLPGAKLYFYEVSTENAQDVWANYQRTVVQPNPLIADSAGRFPPIYYDQTIEYRVLLTDALGNVVFDADPYTGFNLPGRTPLIPLDDDGERLPLARLTFWRMDTTKLAPIYESAGFGDELSNPVTADEGGEFVEIWLDYAIPYRVRLERGDGTLVYDIDYQHVQEILLTSRIYPLEVIEALESSGSAWNSSFTQLIEGIDSIGVPLDGELRQILLRYTDAVPEAIESEGTPLDGELRQILRSYSDAEPEAIESYGDALDGTIDQILITYEEYPPEAISSYGTALGGTLT